MSLATAASLVPLTMSPLLTDQILYKFDQSGSNQILVKEGNAANRDDQDDQDTVVFDVPRSLPLPLVQLAILSTGVHSIAVRHLSGTGHRHERVIKLGGALLRFRFELLRRTSFQKRPKPAKLATRCSALTIQEGCRVLVQGAPGIVVATIAPNAASKDRVPLLQIAQRGDGLKLMQQAYGPFGDFLFTHQVIWGTAGTDISTLQINRPLPVCKHGFSEEHDNCKLSRSFGVQERVSIPDGQGGWAERQLEHYDLCVLVENSDETSSGTKRKHESSVTNTTSTDKATDVDTVTGTSSDTMSIPVVRLTSANAEATVSIDNILDSTPATFTVTSGTAMPQFTAASAAEILPQLQQRDLIPNHSVDPPTSVKPGGVMVDVQLTAHAVHSDVGVLPPVDTRIVSSDFHRPLPSDINVVAFNPVRAVQAATATTTQVTSAGAIQVSYRASTNAAIQATTAEALKAYYRATLLASYQAASDAATRSILAAAHEVVTANAATATQAMLTSAQQTENAAAATRAILTAAHADVTDNAAATQAALISVHQAEILAAAHEAVTANAVTATQAALTSAHHAVIDAATQAALTSAYHVATSTATEVATPTFTANTASATLAAPSSARPVTELMIPITITTLSKNMHSVPALGLQRQKAAKIARSLQAVCV